MNQEQGLQKQDQPGGALVQIEAGRVIEEVKAQIFLAKQFPREEVGLKAKIVKACEDMDLRDQTTIAFYEYARGNTKIQGLAIRVVEEAALNWGNMSYGFNVLDRIWIDGQGVSKVQAYAWDMESNVRRQITFDVRHWRERSGGKGYEITEARDIYELEANQAQRRVRACILAVLPEHIKKAMKDALKENIKKGGGEPLRDRIVKMVNAFAETCSVTQESIEARLKHKIDSINEEELLELRGIYGAIRSGEEKRETFFNTAVPPAPNTDAKDKETEDQEKRNAEIDAEIAAELGEASPAPPSEGSKEPQPAPAGEPETPQQPEIPLSGGGGGPPPEKVGPISAEQMDKIDDLCTQVDLEKQSLEEMFAKYGKPIQNLTESEAADLIQRLKNRIDVGE